MLLIFKDEDDIFDLKIENQNYLKNSTRIINTISRIRNLLSKDTKQSSS